MKASDREKAVLFALAADQLPGGWKQAFILSAQKPEKDVTGQKNITTSAERWRRRPDIIKAFDDARRAVDSLKQDGRTEEDQTGTKEGGRDDNTRTKNSKAGRIDYSDPKAQADKLNELVNTAGDPGEALDALKVIIATQKADRDAARDQKTVQFYRPVRCSQCPIYENAQKKGLKG